MPQEQNLYDTVAYPGGANFKSHPDHMAVMGILYGLEPAPVATCRVLEIGCSEGHNLIPVAYSIPGGQFVGVDLAAEPVAAGQQRIQRLGLTNVRLMQANLMDLDESLGTFDYVIAHGIYAWVPDFVREGLIAIIRKVLAPQGIAFVSYNTNPGGYVRRMMRDMMKSHVAGTGVPTKDVEESLTYLQFIFESMSEREEIRPTIEREIKQMRGKGPYITFHDELSDAFDPVYYSTFARHALRHGLEPLCDAEFPPPTDPFFKPDISAIVNGLSVDPIQREQTFDFIRMRKYRETLLCHAGPQPGSRPGIDLTAIHGLLLASRAVPIAATSPEPDSQTPERHFRTFDGNEFQTKNPAAIAILDILSAAWPRSVPMTELRATLERNGIGYDADALASLFRLILNRVIELHAWQRPVASKVPARPRVSAYCRDAAVHGTKAVSLLHFSVEVSDPTLRAFVSLLDGTREPATLIDTLRAANPELPEKKLVEGMQPALEFLHRAGLFVAEDFDQP